MGTCFHDFHDRPVAIPFRGKTHTGWATWALYPGPMDSHIGLALAGGNCTVSTTSQKQSTCRSGAQLPRGFPDTPWQKLERCGPHSADGNSTSTHIVHYSSLFMARRWGARQEVYEYGTMHQERKALRLIHGMFFPSHSQFHIHQVYVVRVAISATNDNPCADRQY